MGAPDFAAEEYLLHQLERETRAMTEQVKQMLLEKGRSDLIAELERNLRDVATGVSHARNGAGTASRRLSGACWRRSARAGVSSGRTAAGWSMRLMESRPRSGVSLASPRSAIWPPAVWSIGMAGHSTPSAAPCSASEAGSCSPRAARGLGVDDRRRLRLS